MSYEIPPDETPIPCPHCERPFRRADLRDLHVGEAHPEAMSPAEEEAYEAALDDEENDLFIYHLKVVGALTLLYGAIVILYMVVLTL
jgi:hypothetical protein